MQPSQFLHLQISFLYFFVLQKCIIMPYAFYIPKVLFPTDNPSNNKEMWTTSIPQIDPYEHILDTLVSK